MTCLLLVALQVATPSWSALARDGGKMSAELRFELARGSTKARERLLVIQFRAPLTLARVRALEAIGVRFERFAGRVSHVGRFYGARVDRAALESLDAAEDVTSLLPPAPRTLLPRPYDSDLDFVHRLTGAYDLWSERDDLGRRHTGHGVVIADLDGGIDPFHPLFFRADAGVYSWLDVNSNGAFDPAVDAVDLNGDGRVSAGETLRVVGGAIRSWGVLVDAPEWPFDVGRQWLYADTNGNRERDFGVAGGFDEATPAYGEPLFVADDLDRDGVLDPNEKLLRLGTSKIRAYISKFSGQTLERGVNLSLVRPASEWDHGTAVAGILVGGIYGRTQVQGVAPDAELIMVARFPAEGDPGDPVLTDVAVADRVVTMGADIMVHEYGTPIYQFLDGSDPWEQYIDTLSAAGVVQVTATHNFAGSSAKALVPLAGGATQDIMFDVSDELFGFAPAVAFVTLRWRDGVAADVRATLVSPSGEQMVLDGDGCDGELCTYSSADVSARGTSMIASAAYRWDGNDWQPLAVGTWRLQLENLTGTAREVHLVVEDEFGYAQTLELLDFVSEVGTMAWPSTADSAISVGASVGNEPEDGEVVGDLKSYSGRGPRIDGILGVDVVAPEDHFTATVRAYGAELGDYQRFGGTSGALPQVAGAIALLLQVEPGLSPAEVKTRVQQSAVVDAQTGAAPNADWGHGKLFTYRLVTGGNPVANTAPVAHVNGPTGVTQGSSAQLDASGSSDVQDGVADLTFRWDLDYDGVWDLEGVGETVATPRLTALGPVLIKLEVEDRGGLASQTLWKVQVSRVVADEDGGCDCAASGAGGWVALLVLAMRRRR